MMALLIGPIFDRVLNPSAANTPVLLFTDPILHHQFYLDNFVPVAPSTTSGPWWPSPSWPCS